MRLLLCVVVSAVFLGLNYLLNVNEELLVRSKIENSRDHLNFSEEFIRDLASLKSAEFTLPESALEFPGFILGKPLVAQKLIQTDGEGFSLNLKLKLRRLSGSLVQVVNDKSDDLIFFLEKKVNATFPIELVNLKTREKLLVKLDLPKLPPKEKLVQKVSIKSSGGDKEMRKGVRRFEGELDVYQAIVPRFSKSPLRGSMVSGAISVSDGSLESLDIEVTNEKGEVKDLSFNYSEIKDGGVFSFEDNGSEAFGILTNDGDRGLRVRFSTGSFAGAIVSFGSGSGNKALRLPREEVIKLNEQARSDFKKRALSNEFVRESQLRL